MLIYLVAAMLLFGVLGAGMVALSISARETTLIANNANRAQFLAETGLRYAQARYCEEEGWTRFLDLMSGETLEIDRSGAMFTVLATVSPGGRLETSARVYGAVPICADYVEGEKPDDYVVYTGGSGGGFVLPSGGVVDGSIYGEAVTIQPSNVEVTGNVIAKESVTLGSGTIVGGYICAAEEDVRLRSSNTVVEGNIYAGGNVTLESGTTVLGTIYAEGDVYLQSSNTYVGGSIHAGGSVVAANAEIRGSIYAGEDINLRNGTFVGGQAHAGNELIYGGGSASTIEGGSYAGGMRNDHTPSSINQPSPPLMEPEPPMGCPPAPPPPQMQTFTPGTEDITIPQSGSMTIPPGVYGDLTIGGGATVTLQAGDCYEVGDPGCYVFNSFGPANWGQTLRLDLSTGERITVFSAEAISFSGPVEVSTDGVNFTPINQIPIETAKELARRVYWETHTTFTVTQDNATRQWFGTVLSQFGISLGSGFVAVGAFATIDGEIQVHGSQPHITFVIADFAGEHWLP